LLHPHFGFRDPVSRARRMSRQLRQCGSAKIVLLLLFGAIVVAGCETSRGEPYNEVDTSSGSSAEDATCADGIRRLSAEQLTMSIGGQIPGTDRLFHAHVPARMHQEGLELLTTLVEMRAPSSSYVPVQRRWLLIEDGYFAIRVNNEFWSRYQLKLFHLDNSTPELEILCYRENSPDPRVTGDRADEIPPIIKGTALNLEGKAARQVCGFFAEALREEDPQAADWFRVRLWMCRLQMLFPYLVGAFLVVVVWHWWRGRRRRRQRVARPIDRPGATAQTS